MNVSVIISEYNPFHRGHEYLIKRAKNSGATHIIAIMSGNFVQRGDLAITSKYERTKYVGKISMDSLGVIILY